MAKSQIIKDLANNTVDLQTALKRVKVLLQEFDDEKLLEWVNYEIEGYPSDDEKVPEYRKILGQPYCSYFKGSMMNHITYTDVLLSLGDMPEEHKQEFYYMYMTQGIETLRHFVDENKEIDRVIPAEYYPYIAKCNNDLGMIITSAVVKFNMPDVFNIFPRVENKLLDILRYLEKQFGNLDDLDIDLDSKSKDEVKEIKNHIYVMIYYDQSVTVGDKNKIKGSNIVSKISEGIKNVTKS